MIDFSLTDDKEYIYNINGSEIVVAISDADDCTTVLLRRGAAERRIVVQNLTNPTDALIDALKTFRTFIRDDEGLHNVHLEIIKEDWPSFEGQVIVPTWQNKELEEYDLEPRTLTALHKNNIYVRGDVPNNLIKIRKLKSVGLKAAEEIFNKVVKPEPMTRTTVKTGKASKNPMQLVVDSEIPDNLKKFLTKAGIHFVKDIPRDLKKLKKIKGIGHKKAEQILDSI